MTNWDLCWWHDRGGIRPLLYITGICWKCLTVIRKSVCLVLRQASTRVHRQRHQKPHQAHQACQYCRRSAIEMQHFSNQSHSAQVCRLRVPTGGSQLLLLVGWSDSLEEDPCGGRHKFFRRRSSTGGGERQTSQSAKFSRQWGLMLHLFGFCQRWLQISAAEITEPVVQPRGLMKLHLQFYWKLALWNFTLESSYKHIVFLHCEL